MRSLAETGAHERLVGLRRVVGLLDDVLVERAASRQRACFSSSRPLPRAGPRPSSPRAGRGTAAGLSSFCKAPRTPSICWVVTATAARSSLRPRHVQPHEVLLGQARFDLPAVGHGRSSQTRSPSRRSRRQGNPACAVRSVKGPTPRSGWAGAARAVARPASHASRSRRRFMISSPRGPSARGVLAPCATRTCP